MQRGDEVQIQISEHKWIFSLVWQNGNWNLQNLLGEQFHSCSHFYKLYCILQKDTKSGGSGGDIVVTLLRSFSGGSRRRRRVTLFLTKASRPRTGSVSIFKQNALMKPFPPAPLSRPQGRLAFQGMRPTLKPR